MKVYLVSPEQNSYKANMHCHSTLSDGKLTPEQLKKAYRERGYQILAFTDHNRLIDHADLDEPGFITLPSYEVNADQRPGAGDWSYQKTHHLNIYFEHPERFDPALLAERKCTYEIESINRFICEINQSGGLVCYNHPDWSLQEINTYGRIQGLFAMEIFNFGCEVGEFNGNSQYQYDKMLRAGQKIFCLAGDDNHNAFPFTDGKNDSFGGFTVIQAPNLSRASVFRALRTGRFYSSTGPAIYQCYVEDGKIRIEAPGMYKVFVLTRGRRSYSKLSDTPFDQAEFAFLPQDGYLRVVCFNDKNQFAATNAYWLS